MTIFDMSSSVTLLILVIIVIRSLALNHVSKKTFLLLWLVVILKLLIPVTLPSKFSILSFINAFMIKPDKGPGGGYLTNLVTNRSETVVRYVEQSNISLIQIIWLLGVIFLGIYFIATYILCRKKFDKATLVKNSYCMKWIGNLKLKRNIQIKELGSLNTPLSYGIIHPTILLPKEIDWNEEKKVKYILTHEYVHICRFDSILKIILTITLCLHWFNPMVWVMYILANRDIELSCDEAVVRCFGESKNSAYALTLIEMEEQKKDQFLMFNNFARNAIEERIVAIMKIKKKSMFGIAIPVALVLATTTVFATSAKQPLEKSNTEHVTSDAVSSKLNYNFDEYKEYGLSYNVSKDELTYKDKLVIHFSDEYKENLYHSYSNPNGEIAIRAMRDNNFKLTGIEEILGFTADEKVSEIDPNAKGGVSNIQSEINSNLKDDTNGVNSEYSESNNNQNYMKDFKDYGIAYNDKVDCWTYNNKEIRIFLDLQNSKVYFDKVGDEGAYVKVDRSENGKIEKLIEISEDEMLKIIEENPMDTSQGYSIQN